MVTAYLIDTRSAAAVHHPLTLEALQETVGGYICPAFTVPSPTRPGFAVTGYVDDEGAMYEVPPSVILHDGTPLFGPLIVCGLNENDGETVPLTLDEIRWLDRRTRMLKAFGVGAEVTRTLHLLDVATPDRVN